MLSGFVVVGEFSLPLAINLTMILTNILSGGVSGIEYQKQGSEKRTAADSREYQR